jgi:proteasome lid subunit RPN8/RPN11
MSELKEALVLFRTLEEAVRQGLILAGERTTDENEHAGFVMHDPERGNYYLTGGGPMKGTRDRVKITGRPEKKGDRLAAIYHSHPASDKKKGFSEADIQAARQMGVPNYVVQAGSSEARVYDPNTEKSGVKPRGSVLRDSFAPGAEFMPGHLMVREDPSVLDADKAARAETERSQSLIAEILRKPP